ncbi:hypothetical protein N7468_006510 [Penicillium chermesinum]|uniref:SMP-30/Gluconolactonase/LRE-like region domain-containing protein n=1 Tax=Penicillium chermesinum TaxID=63820 RepID=A0A9W9NSC8_9EURO|nr:uncharacterized protein N7468_006510 [Penicillium chermesinum]KAJ5225285.1 hypothetical protein N7468_006510 [Penicillium chermesinum]
MSQIQRWTVSEVSISPISTSGGTLLEGPYHDVANNEFRFVDIWEHKLYRVDLTRGPESLSVVDTGTAIGVTANIGNASESNADQLVVAAKKGFARLDRITGNLSYIREAWGEEDGPGKVDFLHRMLAPVTIPNGIGWNAADDTMYVTDSPTGKIFAFDYEPVTGSLGTRRVFFDLGEPLEPDGFAIDVEGCIWSAIYGGGRVIRISATGALIGQIDLPTRNPTCPTFVGEELWITSAKDDRDDAVLPQSVRYGGCVFRVNVGVRGQAKNEFRLQQ